MHTNGIGRIEGESVMKAELYNGQTLVRLAPLYALVDRKCVLARITQFCVVFVTVKLIKRTKYCWSLFITSALCIIL